ncbi:hypothetical protein [Methylobacterium nonmethylotrophicum]|uniref:Uncharacterized protein n=1 Tax=Methylobacterium nonmethylotrophicum TaxID=1141884 RepID=A0A4Z0NMY7_9HYPH|nr:hypothetical protein [Methylobacterium nonmethylotrophicum]TGD97422.1 hypothetical protein EU555_19845 [Methylobacterium nonmethylotrophicum]
MEATERAYATPDRILQDPRFPASRDVYIDAVLELHEAKPSTMELMLDGGRILVYGIVMALWGGYREDDVASWPTISRLKETVGWFGVASPRQIDLIVARFVQVGHLRIAPAPNDRRLRIVLPTPALIDHDRAFVRSHYEPLGVLFGRERYALPLAEDLAFLKAMRGAWIATLQTMAREIILANTRLLRFYSASAGMLMLMRLVRRQHLRPDGWVAVDYTDFGRRFCVSRTHVRTLLKAAAADGDIEVDARGRLRARPELVAALDSNIAGRLSLLDRSHAAAMACLSASDAA